jgi:RecJ-like exonuclease
MTKAKSSIKKYLVTIIFVLILTTLSCTNNPLSGTTKITDILASPSKYSDSVVRIKGKVTESFIFLGQGYFMLADGTGAIAVVPSKTYPKTGEEVTIKGQVKNAFVIGDKSLTVIIENPQ